MLLSKKGKMIEIFFTICYFCLQSSQKGSGCCCDAVTVVDSKFFAPDWPSGKLYGPSRRSECWKVCFLCILWNDIGLFPYRNVISFLDMSNLKTELSKHAVGKSMLGMFTAGDGQLLYATQGLVHWLDCSTFPPKVTRSLTASLRCMCCVKFLLGETLLVELEGDNLRARSATTGQKIWDVPRIPSSFMSQEKQLTTDGRDHIFLCKRHE